MLNIELLHMSYIPFLDVIQEKWKDTPTKICTRMCIAALFTIAKMWKQAKCPLSDTWRSKMQRCSA